MALIKCKNCGKEISSKAKSCPNCGCPVELKGSDVTNESKSKSLVFIYLFIIVSIIITIFFLANREDPPYTGSMVGTFLSDSSKLILRNDGTCSLTGYYNNIPIYSSSNCNYIKKTKEVTISYYLDGKYIDLTYDILPNGNLYLGIIEYYRQ